MRIAVVGSGISGLGSAYLLNQEHEVRLFEKDSRIGGHSHTVEARFGEHLVPVDTGFIVYNELNYPNLTGLFDHLGVETLESDMSFAVSLQQRRYEYEGSLRGLLASPGNFLRPRFWQMLSDLTRFYRVAPVEAEQAGDEETLGQFIERLQLGAAFVEDHLLPMGAAIWSCPASTMLDFPARSFIQFMNNHRLLHYSGRPVWRTVAGGSRSYVKKITDQLDCVETGTNITGLRREAGGVILTIAGEGDVWFDRVILAAHADQSLALISDASPQERNLLSSFRFQPNRVLLHSDASFMPKKRACWASWNYLSAEDPEAGLCVTYWMNKLQSIADDTPLFVTLNPFEEPDPALLHREFSYDHPVFDRPALRAQNDLASIQGQNGLFFCGAWTRNGFHEDGLASAAAMARTLGVVIPWNSPTEAWPVPDNADLPLPAALSGPAALPGLTGMVGA